MDVGDSRGLFTTGRCALTMDWGDIGTLTPGTYAQDKTGATITPGWKQVLDRATGKLVAVRRDHLPERGRRRELRPVRLLRRLVRRDQCRVARRRSRTPPYEFLSYMSSPAMSGVDVTLGKTGYNPYRTSQFTNQPAVARRRPQPGRDRQLPRGHQDESRQPQHGARPADPADQAVRAGRAGHGRLPVPCEGARRGRDRAGHRRGWNSITDQAGKDKQLAAYVASLGIKK